MKQWMVQKHGRVATNLAADVELDPNLVGTVYKFVTYQCLTFFNSSSSNQYVL